MKKIVWIALLVGIPLILSACSSPAPPEPLEVSINMSEYAYEPTNLEFKVGQEVTLHLTNSGVLDHEIMFGREVMMTDGRPSGYMVDLFETAGIEPVVTIEKGEAVEFEEAEHMEDDDPDEDVHSEDDEHMEGDEHEEAEHAEEDDHAHTGFMVMVPVSHDTYSMKFTVTEDMLGEWEVGCFLLDGVHYTSGMVGSLTVSE